MVLCVSLLSALISSLLSLVLLSAVSAVILGRRRRRKAVGFFHPYTNDGGGGERVLWCAVKAIQEDYPDLDCAIFTGDDASPQSLVGRALDRFGVRLLRPPQVASQYLSTRFFFLNFPDLCTFFRKKRFFYPLFLVPCRLLFSQRSSLNSMWKSGFDKLVPCWFFNNINTVCFEGSRWDLS